MDTPITPYQAYRLKRFNQLAWEYHRKSGGKEGHRRGVWWKPAGQDRNTGRHMTDAEISAAMRASIVDAGDPSPTPPEPLVFRGGAKLSGGEVEL